jgi:hypothetical protein
MTANPESAYGKRAACQMEGEKANVVRELAIEDFLNAPRAK